MRLSFDPGKLSRNIRKHGVSFAAMEEFDWDAALVLADVRFDYPEPRLQPDPAADMRAFYAEEMRRLTSAGWTDASHRAAHVPIEQAMSDVARDGTAGWPAEPSPP